MLLNDVNKLISDDFPDCPFIIDNNIDFLSNLDEPYDESPSIFIKDVREQIYNYLNTKVPTKVPTTVSEKHAVFIKIDRPNKNTPITLRTIINKMIISDHYNDDLIINIPNKTLIGFTKISDKQYIARFN